MICAAVLSNCAPVVAPASNPALAGPVVLDEQGVRELLAGVALEQGDEKAKTAAATVRALSAEGHNATLYQALTAANQRAFIAPLVTGIVASLLGFGFGAVFAYLLLK